MTAVDVGPVVIGPCQLSDPGVHNHLLFSGCSVYGTSRYVSWDSKNIPPERLGFEAALRDEFIKDL